MHYTTSSIANIVNGKLILREEHEILHILTDSRRITSPAHTLFFALKGERHNGHDYLPDVYAAGIRDIVVSALPKNQDFGDCNFILVDDVLPALQRLASYHRKKINIPLIGITGSNGKTIVKEWLFYILSHFHKTMRSPRSYNSQTGVPLSLWTLDSDDHTALIEAGISQAGEMEKLEKIIHPTLGLITNIGEAHQSNFSTLEEKTREKLKLFENAELLIYCMDHAIIHHAFKDTAYEGLRSFTWSKLSSKADLHIKETINWGAKTSISGIYKDDEIEIEIPFTDKASEENAIHSWAILLALDYPHEQIAPHFKNLPAVGMRLEMKKGINNCTIINDSYNSDMLSLDVALDFLMQQHQHPRKTIILSDILQTGKPDAQLYEEVANLIKGRKINRFIGIGEALAKERHRFSLQSEFHLSADDFIKRIRENDFINEAILIKGARKFTFERISNHLEARVHKTVMEINLTAITNNLNYFKALLNPDTKILAMVKAFSYGSGTYEIANLMQYQRAHYLGVAFTDEGIALRKAGINLPIMVMTPEPGSYDLLIDYKLEPQIYNKEQLVLFNDKVQSFRKKHYPIHIKIDTGMHRSGFDYQHPDDLLPLLTSSHSLHVQSVFSHLAAADEAEHDLFTREQINRFDYYCQTLSQALPHPFLKHILNSAGVERFPEAQFDMVRLGIGLYGISTKKETELETVSTLKSYISQIQHIKAGETVGYGRKGLCEQDTTIGIVPIGYADGLSRRLSNGKGFLWVHDQKAPITGKVCMDMCMIDITHIPAKVGDEVILFGKPFSVSALANMLETIPYEILTNISPRVKRIYYQE